jgi:hypothetical protein
VVIRHLPKRSHRLRCSGRPLWLKAHS